MESAVDIGTLSWTGHRPLSTRNAPTWAPRPSLTPLGRPPVGIVGIESTPTTQIPTQTTTQITTQTTTQEKILSYLSTEPSLTRRELAERTGITPDGIKYRKRAPP